MDYTSDDKPSKRSLYKQRAKHLKTEEEFEDDNMPDEIAYFHRLFFEVWDSYRGLTYQNLFYYQMLYSVKLESDIIEMLKRVAAKCNDYVKDKINTKGKK